MSQSTIIAIAVAITIASILPFVILYTCGSSRLRKRRMRDPALGELLITASSTPDREAYSSNCSITGILSAPGLEPTPVTDKFMCKASKWPFPGRKFPVTYDRANPRLFAIEWSQVKSGDAFAMEQAQQLAEAMKRRDGFMGDRK